MANIEEMTITIPSDRIYLSSLGEDTAARLELSIHEFNVMKEWLYNRFYDAVFLKKGEKPTVSEIHDQAKKLLGHDISGYAITSLFSTVNGMISSQRELQKLNRDNLKERIANRKQKIAEEKKRLSTCSNLRQVLISFHKAHHRYPGNKEIGVSHLLANKFPAGEDPLDPEYQNAMYLFECWLVNEIKRVRANVHNMEDKQRREQAKLKSKEFAIPPRSTFGSKKQYRLKDTVPMTENQRAQWHAERDLHRFSQMSVSGRHTSQYGNYQCRYNPETEILELDWAAGAGSIQIRNVKFPWQGNLLKDNFAASSTDKKSVGYRLEIHVDGRGRKYLLVKATITLTNPHMNFYRRDGIIGVDLNYDHLDWDNCNKDGNTVDRGSVKFDLKGKTSNQRKDIIRRATKVIIQQCVNTGKPLVMEEIDLTRRKARLEYGNPNANRKISAFAYEQMTSSLIRQAFRNNVGVYFINPEYTSFIGAVKYMLFRKGPVHDSAAHCIARKGLGFNERVPAYLKKAAGRSKNPWPALYRLIKNTPRTRFCTRLPVYRSKADFEETFLGKKPKKRSVKKTGTDS